MQLYEQFRPQTFDEVSGQDECIRRLRGLESRNSLRGRAFWISGLSGTGKTTIARIVAAHVAGSEFGVEEFDASGFTPAAVLAIERKACSRPLGASGWCFVINESHGLRSDTIRQLLVTLERIPAHVTWIFTTTRDGQASLFDDQIDAHPLLSRCVVLALEHRAERLELSFAKRARHVAQVSGIVEEGAPLAPFVQLAKLHKCNLRAMLGAVDSGALVLA